MDYDDIRALTRDWPGVTEIIQWKGALVMKVAGKVFAIATPAGGVTVKCRDTGSAAFLVEIGVAEPAPHLTRGGWVRLTVGKATADDLAERIRASYETVRDGLPKKVRATL